jgi:hypothetical protein
LLNASFKIFTKVATNRILDVGKNVISPTENAFFHGRNIMEVAIILHEMSHEMHTKKQSAVILKTDFEKAFDKINWSLVQ